MNKNNMCICDFFKEIRFDVKPKDQLYKVFEELVEAEVELVNFDKDKFLLEMIDVIHSSFNVLYKAGYSKKDIIGGINTVYLKNNFRGYYKNE